MLIWNRGGGVTRFCLLCEWSRQFLLIAKRFKNSIRLNGTLSLRAEALLFNIGISIYPCLRILDNVAQVVLKSRLAPPLELVRRRSSRQNALPRICKSAVGKFMDFAGSEF